MRERDGVVARRATLEEILPVRWDVLLPGWPAERIRFPGEDAPEVLQVGAFADQRSIGCATVLPAPWQDQPAWQLRGMGVAHDWQKRGVGELILAEVEDLVREVSDVRLMWCNAREVALGFYQRLGWVIASERFHVENVGPHFKMTKGL
jgi:GNAT superfamily N-acetyltransferase